MSVNEGPSPRDDDDESHRSEPLVDDSIGQVLSRSWQRSSVVRLTAIVKEEDDPYRMPDW